MMPLQWIMFGDYTEPIKKIKDADIPIIVVVESVEEAVKAAELGASAVVAQVDDPCFIVPYLRTLSRPGVVLPVDAL